VQQRKLISSAGFSLVEVMIGLSLLMASFYAFISAQSNSIKAISKMESLATGKSLLTMTALSLQNFTYTELNAVTVSTNNCLSNPVTSASPNLGPASFLRTWARIHKNLEYCADINSFEIKENGSFLNIELIGYFRSVNNQTIIKDYKIAFRKVK